MTRFAYAAAVTLAVLMSGSAFGQSDRPYAGLQTRPVKALSDQQIGDLKAGRGMGLALVAELNGYPGPIHAIELADSLQLSAEQREKMQALLQAMKAEAIPLGEKLIADEIELDRGFASKTITQASLEVSVQKIGATQAALRTAHLKYHLSALEILTPTQAQRYAELRGYSSGHGAPSHHGGHRH